MGVSRPRNRKFEGVVDVQKDRGRTGKAKGTGKQESETEGEEESVDGSDVMVWMGRVKRTRRRRSQRQGKARKRLLR